jgi:NMD protein affecting ribosome stability and mRNA decay
MSSRNAGGGSRPIRRDRLIQEFEHDTYKSRGKLPEPTVCSDCRAVFHKGRWQWLDTPAGAHQTRCPACHRIADRYPGGYLTLGGDFLKNHRDEILHLARNIEAREKNQHPLRRVMAIEDQDDAVLITTTDMQLARAIGDAVHAAYQGEIDYRYTEESNILRVGWSR